MPPAVASSYDSSRRTTSASSSSIAASIGGALLERHLAEQVGEVVVLHLVEHADETVDVETLDESQLLGLGQLLEHVGETLVVHRLGELASLRGRQRSHHVGNVGRVHVAQARRLGRHLGRAPRRATAPRPSRRDGSSGGDEWNSDARAGSWRPPTTAIGRRRHAGARRRSPSRRRPRVSMSSAPMSTSPVRGLNGLRSTSQLRSRAPSPSRSAIRFDVDEDPAALAGCHEADHARRRCRERPGTRTRSSILPIGAPPASSSGKRITRNA